MAYLCHPFLNKKTRDMLIIPLKEGENIERALKRYKKKFEKTGVLRELRDRQQFTKPSVKTRQMRLKAAYKQRMQQMEM
jgi:small subunit ribosomal protein S21